MSDLIWAGGAALLVAGVATNLLVPPAIAVAKAVRALDYPGGRRRHEAAVPRLGGLAIVAGIAFGAGGVAVVMWPSWGGNVVRSELAALLIGTCLVFLAGLVDDLIGLSAGKRFLVEFVAAGLLVGAGWRFEVLQVPGLGDVALGPAGVLVSLIWIVGVTNAVNLMDGLDGLAAGIVAIMAASLLFLATLIGNTLTVVLLAAMVGSCVGFLRHNWAPARIFMGDAGALTLGFLLAAVTVHSSLKAPAAVAILVPVLALGLPVIDTLLVMAVRFLRASGSRPTSRVLRMFRGDRTHLHHLLERAAGRRKETVYLLYGLTVLFCAGAMWVAVSKSDVLGYTLLIVEVIAVMVVRWVGMNRAAKELSEEKRRQAREELFGGGETDLAD